MKHHNLPEPFLFRLVCFWLLWRFVMTFASTPGSLSRACTIILLSVRLWEMRWISHRLHPLITNLGRRRCTFNGRVFITKLHCRIERIISQLCVLRAVQKPQTIKNERKRWIVAVFIYWYISTVLVGAYSQNVTLEWCMQNIINKFLLD